ncbi:hypothetical protein PG985_014082 [Apiospora marii]|uniref:uncharacterized protein n=1 Tax=Apiospora marii TaxID=335849 RepID=UPI0031327B84
MAEERLSNVEVAAPGQSPNPGAIVAVIVISALIVAIGGAIWCTERHKRKEKENVAADTGPIDRSEDIVSGYAYNSSGRHNTVGNQLPDQPVGGSSYDHSSSGYSAAIQAWAHESTQAASWADTERQIHPPPTYGVTYRNSTTGVGGMPNDEYVSSPYTSDRTVVCGGETRPQPQSSAVDREFKASRMQPAAKSCSGSQEQYEIQLCHGVMAHEPFALEPEDEAVQRAQFSEAISGQSIKFNDNRREDPHT